jgi:hypothetical protein
MERDQLSQELEKFVYEKIQKTESKETYMRFWNSISFPTKIGAPILHIDPIPGIKETYEDFKKFVNEADVEFRQLANEQRYTRK